MSGVLNLPEDLIPLVVEYHPLFCNYQHIYQLHSYHNGRVHRVHGITKQMYQDISNNLGANESTEIMYHHRSPFDSAHQTPFMYHLVNRYLETNLDQPENQTPILPLSSAVRARLTNNE